MNADEISTPMRKDRKSSSVISSQIAQEATLATTLQAVAEVRPGNLSRFHNYNGFKIENYLNFAVTLSKPMIDIATRGIMVERGFIDFDEVDLGWIQHNTISKMHNQSGYSHFVGILLSFSPIAAAAGYILSSSDDTMDLRELRALSGEFLENTTPEDADNLYTALYGLNSKRFKFINNFAETMIEGKNHMLDEELNLVDMYRLFSKESLIFNEMYSEFDFSFNQGLQAFDEAIDNSCSITDAISHTFISVLAQHTPKINGSEIDHKLPYKIKQEAISIIENGGYLTSAGKVMTGKLENFILNYKVPIKLHEIAEITSTVTFISFLKNKNLISNGF